MKSVRTRHWSMMAAVGAMAWGLGCNDTSSHARSDGSHAGVAGNDGSTEGAGAGGAGVAGNDGSTEGAGAGGAGFAGNDGSTDGAGAGAVTLPVLGKLIVTRDDARAMKDVVDVDGGYLWVTDASGTKWTLDIPEQPGFLPTTVTLTPLSMIDSGDGPSLTGGVLFEPEGLVFSKPARLTITPPAGTPAQTAYVFESDGSGLWYANTEDGKVVVPHFSGAGMGRTLDDPCAEALKAYNDAMAAAKELTGDATTPTDVRIPDPPSVSVQCLGNQEATGKLIHAWARSVAEPEFTMIARILAAERQRALFCPGYSSTPEIPWRLSARLDKKIDLLMALPSKPETTQPIVIAELMIARSQALLADNEARQASVLADAGKRFNEGAKELLQRLRTKHDYEVVEAFFHFARSGEIMTRTDNMYLVGDFIKAYRFRVDLDVAAEQSYPGYTDSDGTEYYGNQTELHAQGSGDFGYDASKPATVNRKVLLPNQITMTTKSYTSKETPMPNNNQYATTELVAAGSYAPPFRLSLDACDASATYVFLNHLGSEEEDTCKWQVFYPDEPEEDRSGSGPCGTQGTAGMVFKQYHAGAPDSGGYSYGGYGYTFRASITNGEAIAIRQDITTVVPSPTSGIGTLSMTVTHTPN